MGKPLTFEERAELLGLSLPRARFLAAEAHRIGLGLKDTADMMGMTRNEVIAFGLFFPTRSAYGKPPGLCTYNLFPPEPIKPDVCFR